LFGAVRKCKQPCRFLHAGFANPLKHWWRQVERYTFTRSQLCREKPFSYPAKMATDAFTLFGYNRWNPGRRSARSRACEFHDMSAIHALLPLYSVAGFAVGLLVGLTGVGGGSLMTPLLILLFGIHPSTAVGTDLLYAAATKTAGSAVHGFNRTIDWHVVRRLASGSVPMTVITLTALSRIGIHSATAHELITALLAIALMITAATLVFRDALVARYATRLRGLPPPRVAGLTIMVGALLGVFVSLTSVGAGAIGVTALVLLYPQLPTARIVGSDIAHAVPLTLVAGLGHWFLGTINLEVLASLLAGSIPGILLGSFAAVRIPEKALRLVLAATLVVVATKLSMGMQSPPSSNVASAVTPR
jgi:uncharacterized protein